MSTDKTNKTEDSIVSSNIENSLVEYYNFSKKSTKAQLISLALFFLIIPLFVYMILSIVWSIKTLIARTHDRELSSDFLIFGLIGFFFIGVISSLIVNKRIEGKYPEIINNK